MRIGDRIKRRGLIALLLLACSNPVVPADLEMSVWEPLPVYAVWWAEVEECAGIKAPMDRVEWLTTPATLEYDAFECVWPTGCCGVWLEPHTFLLSEAYVENWDCVAHEMLHAIRGRGGHPDVFYRCELMVGYGG